MFNVNAFLWTMLVLFALGMSSNLRTLANLAHGIPRTPMTPKVIACVIGCQAALMFWLVMLLVTR